MASGSLSNSTARMVAPIGPIPRKVTPMPCGTQTVCWYFQPVAKITNSVTVAITNNGTVRYEIFFVFNRCHGANHPCGCRAAEPSELFESFIYLTFVKSSQCDYAPKRHDEIFKQMDRQS